MENFPGILVSLRVTYKATPQCAQSPKQRAYVLGRVWLIGIGLLDIALSIDIVVKPRPNVCKVQV